MTISWDSPLSQRTESSGYQEAIGTADSTFLESNILVIRTLTCYSAVSFCSIVADSTRLSVLSDLQVQRFI